MLAQLSFGEVINRPPFQQAEIMPREVGLAPAKHCLIVASIQASVFMLQIIGSLGSKLKRRTKSLKFKFLF